jgi:hypothetical protein
MQLASRLNASSARIEFEKITSYLLSDTHPVGRAKARFFQGLGFQASRPEALLASLLRVAREGEVLDQEITVFGTKYMVDGTLEGPAGISAPVRTIWILERDSVSPRLVTAYPGTSRRGEEK